MLNYDSIVVRTTYIELTVNATLIHSMMMSAAYLRATWYVSMCSTAVAETNESK